MATVINTLYSKENINKIINGKLDTNYIKLFGIIHFKYSDCNINDLICINEKISVHKKCFNAFEKMKLDALKENIQLEIISGYRSSEYQISVFQKKFRNKNAPTAEELEARLKFSAPPGYSEHHTGLAIDINSVEDDFAETKEYEWLRDNANKYGFENSFPLYNKQGLGFEPWHWRFIDNETEKIFAPARSL